MADNRMMVRADFRAVAGVTATDVRVAPRWQRTPYITRTAGSTVKVTHADGTTEIRSAASFRPKRDHEATTRRIKRSNARIIETARIGNVKGMDWTQ